MVNKPGAYDIYDPIKALNLVRWDALDHSIRPQLTSRERAFASAQPTASIPPLSSLRVVEGSNGLLVFLATHLNR